VTAERATVETAAGESASSEWMKIMLEEIARKKAEAEQIRDEEQRRRDQDSST
jgi:hypothetical protein